MCKVYVTGMGMVSALGIGVDTNRDALISRRSGIGYAKHLNSLLRDQLPVGEIDHATSELFRFLHNPGNLQESRLVLLAAIALQEALATAGMPLNEQKKAGFINSTTVGGMADVEYVYEQLIDPSIPEISADLGDSLDCAHGTEELARHFGLTRFISTVSTACSSSANAIIYGARLIRGGMLDQVICGGVDTLTRFTINGFNSLKNMDRNHCKPFDANRNGLNLGEGAAYLVLESEESICRTGRKPLAQLSGYCNFNEAFHPTAPSPDGDGAYQAMKGAIREAGLTTMDISFINAHGTATINNDIAEAFALRRLFGENIPPFSSTKSYTGHTLAPSGAIEAIYSILSILNNEAYPVLNYETAMPEVELEPVTEVMYNAGIQHVLSNSFGFGGNNASLLFSKYD
ncbi:beta-ketoacyl-[acyl-carrier-protein] synthase family protein [Flavihumibacter stibioxidans]|uniref:Ketosynthase family 3 (KS3) domain-containing protein n=1 Tax=Flavihumibacter stibioxidans TaxID=1834163 RepID=A0ABR7M579_9BACT|nr:beta-ketoacyl-[acyl-carrier-protein] synthase family protein [Flavihumibacter stibioxidans]MBC6490173.1 hypothetical protein [Flavihumibacter stibioxidans]